MKMWGMPKSWWSTELIWMGKCSEYRTFSIAKLFTRFIDLFSGLKNDFRNPPTPARCPAKFRKVYTANWSYPRNQS